MEGTERLIRRSDVPKPTAKELLLAYVAPGILLTAGIYHHTVTLLDVLFIQRQPSLLIDVSRFREQAFSRFWLANGEALSGDMPGELASLLKTLRGAILDIGPGSGEQLHLYTSSAPNVDAIYGAEPAEKLHAKLAIKANDAGFERKYHILGCGAEPSSLIPALAREGLLQDGGEGSFDEIVSIRVLCGVPDVKETAEGLYGLLRPGGRLIVMEHVICRDSIIARTLQAVYMWLGRWRFWMGGCCLDRDTEKVLREAGAWSEVELKTLNAWSTIPQIVGYLVKR
ncbi:Methyltransferase 7A [Hyphodiscus hymeniophilus]|uniref:Methyltransferase 7A n=1 Tax=Hyphodiscus hymeniophilus TaxID=353542 RepID=A0A9P6SNF5_9HELO|nr:Methyltransferase 7A [Hyphodiscus hymeniophilus]